ncbi:MAG: AraC family transcriptional regulator [Planctomycetota bacterium]|jgi:AraC-like DNA-binding protein
MRSGKDGAAPRSDADATHRDELLRAVESLATVDDLQPTEIEGLWTYRADAPTEPCVSDYRLSLCIAVQGTKRVQFGDEILEYGPHTCLLVALPLPLEARVVEASPEKPCLALVLDIDPSVVRETAGAMEEFGKLHASQRAVRQLAVEGPLLESILRMARAATSERDAHVLGESLKREVIYRILESDQGGLLRWLASRTSGAHRIERVIRFMDRNLKRRISVPELAELAHMSESSLYHAFKEVTSMSPLQYLKRIRLQKARALMVGSDRNASQAATAVGYKSVSQFSREFKALFGQPPSRVRSA